MPGAGLSWTPCWEGPVRKASLPAVPGKTLTALANVGPANPREFAEVTSTPDVLSPLTTVTGGAAV
jgi:hypothetical protein